MSQPPNLFLHVGKQIKDEYGRVIGKVASFSATPSGKFDAIFVESGNGKFIKASTEYLRFDGEDLTLTSRITAEIGALCDQIPLIWRKDQALKDLSEKEKISDELYEDMHNNFEGVLNQLKEEAQKLAAEIDKEIARCNEETKALNYALVHLEIEHEIGKLNHQNYETAFQIIQESLKRIRSEKSDFESTRTNLSNIILGETPDILEQEEAEMPVGVDDMAPESSESSESSGLPEPPVVVYVKEVGKAGA